MKSAKELQSLQEVVELCQSCIKLYQRARSEKEAEAIASKVVGLMTNKRYDDWRHKAPILGDIVEEASDLEWSNVGVGGSGEGWQKIEQWVATLEEQAAHN